MKKARHWVSWKATWSLRRAMDAVGMGPRLAPRRLVLRRETVSIPRLGPGLEGLRIAHLSDLHCGAYMTVEILSRIFDRVWSESPDLLVMTGDFVDYHARGIHQLTSALSDRPPLPFGVFAVLGNHDYVNGGSENVASALEQAGVEVLRNHAVHLERGEAGIWLIGVDDFCRGTVDFGAAFREVNGADPRILLCHNPDVVGHARDLGIDLMLSGHTHGGQIVFPFVGPAKVASSHGRQFLGGSVWVPPTRLHISRGVGMAGIPVRLRCPSEFSLLTLACGVAGHFRAEAMETILESRRRRLRRRRANGFFHKDHATGTHGEAAAVQTEEREVRQAE